jgi:hypothetical protein
MQKIKNIKVEDTEFSENIKWADVLSLKIRLLQSFDWVLLQDSEVRNLQEVISWRKKIKNCNRKNFSSAEEMRVFLLQLEKSAPQIKYKIDLNSIEILKEKLYKNIRYYFNSKLEQDLKSHFSNINLINERYEEINQFKLHNNIDLCPLIKSYSDLTSNSVEDTISKFLLEKKKYYYYLFKYQSDLEQEIKLVSDMTNKEDLIIKYEKYTTWISTLTLDPVQM